MTAPGATFSDTSSFDTMTCRLCRHVITLNTSSPPRRCPSCKAWLAARQPALLRKASSPSAPHERMPTEQREQERHAPSDPLTSPDQDTLSKGWRAISKASLFHRFDAHTAVTQPDLPPRHQPPEPVAEPVPSPRRELSFEFKAPAHRDPPKKEVTPVVLRDELARREHVDTSDEDAIEAWLDAVESEVLDDLTTSSNPLFTDVSFDSLSSPSAHERVATSQARSLTRSADSLSSPSAHEQVATSQARSLTRSADSSSLSSAHERVATSQAQSLTRSADSLSSPSAHERVATSQARSLTRSTSSESSDTEEISARAEMDSDDALSTVIEEVEDFENFDGLSKLIDIDAFEIHREEEHDEQGLATLDLEREPERFELKLGAQHIGPLDKEGVNALIISGLDAHAMVRCEGQQRWDVISEHDAFGDLYALTAHEEERSQSPGQEVDELDSETMILDAEVGQTMLGMQHDAPNEEVEEVRGDTLMMFATPEVEAPSIEAAEPELLVEQEEATEPEHAVSTSPQAIEAESSLEALVPMKDTRRSVWRIVAGVLGVLVVFALGSLAGAVLIESRTAPEDGPGARSAKELLETMIMLPRERATYQAVRGARTVVHLSSNQKFMTAERQRDVALELAAAQDHVAALKVFGVLWQNEQARSPSTGLAIARSAREVGRHELARQVLLDAATLEPNPELRAQITSAFNASISEDEALHPPVLTLEPDVHLDVVRALGGGKSISLKFVKDGKTLHAFKPSQLDWAEGWRAEVASYLLCEAIFCHFEVPRSLPVRISREDFELLYGRFTSTKQTTYAEQFAERLIWTREAGPDGVERDYLYGVMKDWVPGFVDFPIEYRDIWDDWLDASKDPSVMNRDLRDALSVLRVRQEGKYFTPMMDERQGASTRDVARGISDILTFDYVTSNWDRYSGVETYYGVNNQFDEGKFLSLDNGAAFHILTQRKVEQRFEPVTRFSRSTIAALGMLDPAHTNDILFPEPGQEARQRLEVFWTQRDRLLARVDELVQTHGKDRVLYFE